MVGEKLEDMTTRDGYQIAVSVRREQFAHTSDSQRVIMVPESRMISSLEPSWKLK